MSTAPTEERDYLHGYRTGYLDGLRAAKNGTTEFPDVMTMPVETLHLSVRSMNCLRNCHCLQIQDVVNLTTDEILAMRNLGKISADEIARALHRQKLFHSAWNAFLR